MLLEDKNQSSGETHSVLDLAESAWHLSAEVIISVCAGTLVGL